MKNEIYIKNTEKINKWFDTSNEGYQLIDIKYENRKIKIKLNCPIEEHDEYWVDWQHFYNRGDRCGKCRYKKNGEKRIHYNHKRIKEIVESEGYKLLTEDASGVDTKISVQDRKGFKYETTIYRIVKLSLPEPFSTFNPHTIDNIKLWLSVNKKPFVLLSNVYLNCATELKWLCSNCGEVFSKIWNTVYSAGYGCHYCSGRVASKENNLQIKNPNLTQEWDYEKNYPIVPNDILPNCTKKFWWICNECGHNWKKSVHFRNQSGNSCPVCTKSTGEKRIMTYLDKNNINYIKQFKFDECKNKKRLPFDFFLPDLNLCIEYQGEFHYKYIKGFFSKEALLSQQERDRIKEDYCKINNINLLKIPYWEFDNVEDILSNYLHETVIYEGEI